jgi:hypothetical protein
LVRDNSWATVNPAIPPPTIATVCRGCPAEFSNTLASVLDMRNSQLGCQLMHQIVDQATKSTHYNQAAEVRNTLDHPLEDAVRNVKLGGLRCKHSPRDSFSLRN